MNVRKSLTKILAVIVSVSCLYIFDEFRPRPDTSGLLYIKAGEEATTSLHRYTAENNPGNKRVRERGITETTAEFRDLSDIVESVRNEQTEPETTTAPAETTTEAETTKEEETEATKKTVKKDNITYTTLLEYDTYVNKATPTDGYCDGQTYHITVYVPSGDKWGYQTCTGTRSRHLETCAVDPNVIPLGSTIEVNGLVLYCCDIGGAVKGRTIDIFYDGSEEEAMAWICRFGDYHTVRVLEWG